MKKDRKFKVEIEIVFDQDNFDIASGKGTDQQMEQLAAHLGYSVMDCMLTQGYEDKETTITNGFVDVHKGKN